MNDTWINEFGITLSVYYSVHAPKGKPISIGGKVYQPGEFIPDEALDKVTIAEKSFDKRLSALVAGKESRPDGTSKPPTGAAKEEQKPREIKSTEAVANRKPGDITESDRKIALRKLSKLPFSDGRAVTPLDTTRTRDTFDKMKEVMESGHHKDMWMDPSQLTATQDEVDVDSMKAVIDRLGKPQFEGLNKPIIAVKVGDRIYINEGHHRASGSLLLGVKVPVKLYMSALELAEHTYSNNISFSTDASGHEHDAKGRFGNGGGGTNKKKSKKDKKQATTHSPEFKAWFGDWEDDPANASKVVNDDREPQETHGTAKKVFHGTAGKFDVFDKNRIRAVNVGRGFYFAENKDIAENYASNGEDPEDEGYGNTPPIILEVYLNIRNPLDLDDEDNYKLWQATCASLTTPGDITNGRDAVNTAIQKMGYDGIVHTSSNEFGSLGTPGSTAKKSNYGKCWIAFEPNQIKSVENKGTFDPSSENMNLSIQDLQGRLHSDDTGQIQLGMVGDEWHGPKPPKKMDWTAIAPGPRGGKRWKIVQSDTAKSQQTTVPKKRTPKNKLTQQQPQQSQTKPDKKESTKKVSIANLTPKLLAKMEPDYSKISDPKLREHVKKGVNGYYNGDFTDMNGVLRGTHSGESRLNSKENTAARLDGFKRAFDVVGHELENDTMVYRVVKSMPFDVTTPGTIFKDKGFVSTTADKNLTRSISMGGQRTIFNIKAPKGMKVIVGMGGRDTSKEVTLPSNINFRVVASKKVGSTNIVQLEIVQ